MSIADSFLSLDRESQVSALSKMNTEQKTRLQTLLTERKSSVEKDSSTRKPKPMLTESGNLLSDFVSEDLQDGVKFAVKTLAQFGEGMHDTIDDIGKLLGAPEYTRESPEPKGLIQKGTRFTGSFFTPGGAESKAGIVLANALKTPATMAKAQRVANFIKPIAEQTGKGIAAVGEILSSVPKKALERAMKNPQKLDMAFDKTRTYKIIGKRAQKAMNWAIKESGEAVGREADAIKGIQTNIPIGDLVSNIEGNLRKGIINEVDDKAVKDVLGRLKSLRKTDLKGFHNTTSAENLHGMKQYIDTLVNYSSETVKKASSNTVRALKESRDLINKELRLISTDYANANDAFKKASDLKGRLLTNLKDDKLSSSMRIIMNADDATKRKLLQELDELAPEGLKFYEKLEDAQMLQALGELWPGRGGGSGGTQGAANLLRTEISRGLARGGALLTVPTIAKPFLVASMSPMGQKQLIKRTAKASKFISKKGKRVAPVSLIKSGRLIQEQGEN